jgi:hypothetical protein
VVSWTDSDRYRWLMWGAASGILAVLVLAAVGVPSLDLHGPLHRAGVMDPACGGTRAAYLLVTGKWRAAWHYNPVVFPLAAAVVTVVGRAAIGAATGRWLELHLPRRLLLALTVIGLVVLEIRQQLHAELLLQRWSGS